ERCPLGPLELAKLSNLFLEKREPPLELSADELACRAERAARALARDHEECLALRDAIAFGDVLLDDRAGLRRVHVDDAEIRHEPAAERHVLRIRAPNEEAGDDGGHGECRRRADAER